MSEPYCSTNQLYVIKDEVYGQSIYHSKQVPKQKLKKYALIKSGRYDGPPTFKITKVLPTTNDYVQTFDQHSQIDNRAGVETRAVLSNVIPGKYDPPLDRFKKISDDLAKQIKPLMPEFWSIFNVDAMKEYINSRNYTEKQKAKINKVEEYSNGYTWLEILRENWDKLYINDQGKLIMKGLHNPVSLASRFEAFLKDESYFENKRPRNITGASDIDKFVLGVVFGAFNHAVFSQKWTIKKTPYKYRPAVITNRLGTPQVIYGTDFSAFESSSTYQIQEVMEQNLYRKIYPEFYQYSKKYQLPFIFKTSGSDPNIYYVDTCRASGAPNTSLGNTVNNYCFIKSIEEEFQCHAKFLIEGDDCILNVDKHIPQNDLKEYAIKCGFDLKLDEFDTFGHVGFLSLYWEDNLVPDMTNVWKHLIDAFAFRPRQVGYNSKTKTINNALYWNRLTSKLLSLTLLAPKHELIYLLFKKAYEFNIHYNGHKKIKMMDKRKMMMMKDVDNIIESNNQHNLLAKIESEFRGDLVAEIRTKYAYGPKLVELVKQLLDSNTEEKFNRAVNIILDTYYIERDPFIVDIEFLN